MVKRAAAFLLCALLLAAGAALADNASVVDECGLFSGNEIREMEKKIAEIRDTFQMDAVILTTDRVPANADYDSMEQTQYFADTYFDSNGYGLGEDRSGILYLLDMKNRYSYVSTRGVMIDYISEGREEELLEAADARLAQRQYGKAAIAILEKLSSILSRGIEEGHFRFDEVTGERLGGIYNKLTEAEAFLAGIAGIAAAALFFGITAARYGLKRSTYRFNRDTQSDLQLSRDKKTFLRQQVTRTRIPSGGGGRGGFGGGHSGGSGVHFSGGVSHGGGGHHF